MQVPVNHNESKWNLTFKIGRSGAGRSGRNIAERKARVEISITDYTLCLGIFVFVYIFPL